MNNVTTKDLNSVLIGTYLLHVQRLWQMEKDMNMRNDYPVLTINCFSGALGNVSWLFKKNWTQILAPPQKKKCIAIRLAITNEAAS